ncbi:MAG: hypothetical protein FWC93_03790 [Defluviitaleaceae bacterium]|nr:hypothetical protein [Defluviitaleaceae bacterium]
MTSAAGKQILFVVGISYIIFGGLGFLGAFLGMGSVTTWDIISPMASGMSWAHFNAILLIAGLFHIFTGITGVINRARLEKASMLRILGGTDIALAIFIVMLNMAVSAYAPRNLASIFILIIRFVLPVLYIIGAQKNLAANASQ